MQKIRKFDLQINCPVYSEYKEDIEKLTQSINGNKTVSKKVGKAQELLDIMDHLSSCAKFDKEKEACKNCRFILNLIGEIARMIVVTNEIAY